MLLQIIATLSCVALCASRESSQFLHRSKGSRSAALPSATETNVTARGNVSARSLSSGAYCVDQGVGLDQADCPGCIDKCHDCMCADAAMNRYCAFNGCDPDGSGSNCCKPKLPACKDYKDPGSCKAAGCTVPDKDDEDAWENKALPYCLPMSARDPASSDPYCVSSEFVDKCHDCMCADPTQNTYCATSGCDPDGSGSNCCKPKLPDCQNYQDPVSCKVAACQAFEEPVRVWCK